MATYVRIVKNGDDLNPIAEACLTCAATFCLTMCLESTGLAGSVFYAITDMYDYSTKHEGEGVGAWEMLRVASVQADETAFVTAAKRIDWSRRTEQEHVEAIQMALSAGAHRFDRDLAAAAHERYPTSDKLRRIAELLAPPRVTLVERPVDKVGRQANRTWLKANATSGCVRGARK